MPKRIQRRRTKGWRKPANVVNVARPSRWGNPYRADDWPDAPLWEPKDRLSAARAWLKAMFKYDLTIGSLSFSAADVKRELRGKSLMCYCPLDEPCHADVLLEIANADE